MIHQVAVDDRVQRAVTVEEANVLLKLFTLQERSL